MVPKFNAFSHRTGRLAKAFLSATAATALGLMAAAAHAQTTIDSTATVPGTYASPWTVPGILYVGYNGTGTLNINPGGTVSSAESHIGYNSGSNGTVNVSGAGATWTDSQGIYLGHDLDVTGTLHITSGGAVSTPFLTLGAYLPNGSSIIVDGTGSTLTAEQFQYSSGDLTVSGGGKVVVVNSFNLMGAEDGTLSTITVTGKDAGGTPSTLTINGDLPFGVYGNNKLVISDGGVVSDVDGVITTTAYVSAYSYLNTVVVDGAGSKWINTGYLWVGESDNGALVISNGGEVSAAGGVTVDNWGAFTVPSSINIGATSGNAPVAPGILTTPTVDLNMDGFLVFNHTDTSGNYVFAAKITDCVAGGCGVLAGSGAINQMAGTTVLTGNSDAFSGTTSITGGTLRVNGTLGDAISTMAVASGGTLGGTGTIGSAVTVGSGGTFNPGDGATPGSMTTVLRDLTFNAGAHYAVNIQQTTSSLARVNGAVALGGVDVAMNFAAPPTLNMGDTIVLLDASAGSMTGAPASSTITTAGYIFTLSVQNKQLIATVTGIVPTGSNQAAIPTLNPAALALLALGLMAAVALGRKRG